MSSSECVSKLSGCMSLYELACHSSKLYFSGWVYEYT